MSTFYEWRVDEKRRPRNQYSTILYPQKLQKSGYHPYTSTQSPIDSLPPDLQSKIFTINGDDDFQTW